MPEVVVPDCWRVVLEAELPDGQSQVNVFHVMPPDTDNLTVANADLVVDAFENAFLDSTMAQDLTSVWQAAGLTFTDLRQAPFTQLVRPVNMVGSSGNPAMPNATALVATWRTDFIGRSYRGRTYWSGWTETASVGNGPSGAVQDRYQVFCANLIEYLGAIPGGYKLGVVSRVSDGAPRVPPIITEITNVAVGGIWDQQRRRTPNEVV